MRVCCSEDSTDDRYIGDATGDGTNDEETDYAYVITLCYGVAHATFVRAGADLLRGLL